MQKTLIRAPAPLQGRPALIDQGYACRSPLQGPTPLDEPPRKRESFEISNIANFTRRLASPDAEPPN